MIYLIQDCYKDSNNNYHDILKIGYSKDDFNSIRKSAYDTHNYGYTLLYQREGSVELEKYLHKKFKSLLLPNSTEWFSYSQDIIDSFNNITEEDIFKEGYIISKEEYIEMCREYILSNLVLSSNSLYIKYIDSLLGDLRKLYEKSYKDILLWEENVYKRDFKDNLTSIEKNIKSFWINFDFSEYFKNLPQQIKFDKGVFRNEVLFLYKANTKADATINKTQEEFDKTIKEKKEATNKMLLGYSKMSDTQKKLWANTVANARNLYENDFLGISKRTGEATYNYLVEIANERAYDVSRKDYQDMVTIKRGMENIGLEVVESNNENELGPIFDKFQKSLESVSFFEDKMKIICDYKRDYPQLFTQYKSILSVLIPSNIENYINLIGHEKCKALGYKESPILDYIKTLGQPEKEEIYKNFEVNKRYCKSEIKEKLRDIYSSLNLSKTPKATDLEEYFDLKTCQIIHKETGKKDNGYLILSKKDV